jgi:hypothetical protein
MPETEPWIVREIFVKNIINNKKEISKKFRRASSLPIIDYTLPEKEIMIVTTAICKIILTGSRAKETKIWKRGNRREWSVSYVLYLKNIQ